MKVELEEIFSILRECSYEFDDCDNAEDCIENLIIDILDNIKGQTTKNAPFSFFDFLDVFRLNFIFVKFYFSYSAPATVKFYTLSNFGRANKLRLISYE